MASSVRRHTIDEDSEIIDNMVEAAKFRQWEKVWEILRRKPYIVNCIPEKRAWSAFHQAVFANDKEAVRKLIEEYNADIHIKTRICKKGEVIAGSDAIDVAKLLPTSEVKDFLITKKKDKQRDFDYTDYSYFFQHIRGKVNNARECPFILLTIANYKDLFLNGKRYLPSSNLYSTMHQVMNELPSTWERVREKIIDNLITIDREFTDELKECKTKTKFYAKLIETYTKEAKRQSLYTIVAEALWKQPDLHESYEPRAEDLAVGPYVLTLNAIITAWEELNSYSSTTYRGVDKDVSKDYEVGETIVFTSFISSSKSKGIAMKNFAKLNGTVFHIDNSAYSSWRPKDITRFSSLPFEGECLYPIGAEFKITCKNESERSVDLELQN